MFLFLLLTATVACDVVVGVAAAAARFVLLAVTTVGNFAEQNLPASGTPARGFRSPMRPLLQTSVAVPPEARSAITRPKW